MDLAGVVSIHAPRAGRDQHKIRPEKPLARFNPRAPRGARHEVDALTGAILEFQSTRPARGATRMSTTRPRTRAFQSTRPARGATRRLPGPWLPCGVSIHAPRAGRDHQANSASRVRRSFNPRAPRGARPSGLIPAMVVYWFQSTRPARGATRPNRAPARGVVVSIHAPRAGRDFRQPRSARLCAVSIHAPRAGRDSLLFFVA